MATQSMAQRSALLDAAAASLDIPDHLYEAAVLKYEDIGTWLGAEDSELREFLPEIYPQGSFRLGTVVRPIHRTHEYDIDLVCRLAIDKEGRSSRNPRGITPRLVADVPAAIPYGRAVIDSERRTQANRNLAARQ
jgi:hypothetical protein